MSGGSSHEESASGNLGSDGSRVIRVSPKTVQEIKESKDEKFMIKLTSRTCPPCKIADSWLSSEFKPKRSFLMYEVKYDVDKEQDSIVETLAAVFNVSGFPSFIVTNSKLEKIDMFTGWRSERFEALVEKYFS